MIIIIVITIIVKIVTIVVMIINVQWVEVFSSMATLQNDATQRSLPARGWQEVNLSELSPWEVRQFSSNRRLVSRSFDIFFSYFKANFLVSFYPSVS